jgi:hypothetical protein
MVMPELSTLFTKKISKTDLMERLVLQQVRSPLGTRKKITNHQTTIYFTPKNQPKAQL